MAAVTEQRQSETKKLKNKAKASLALLLIAVISISTATYAWFSLSNSTSVQSMIVEVGTGTVLKAYAGATTSTDISKYFPVIKSTGTSSNAGELITSALPDGIDELTDVKLWPVTSGDGVKFYTQGTNIVIGAESVTPEKAYYLQLTLTFIADTAMDVYLNGSNSSSTATDGTLVAADSDDQRDKDAVRALRISFETPDGNSTIYEPGWEGDTPLAGNAADNLSGVIQSTFHVLGDNTGRNKGKPDKKETPVLFSLVPNTPKQVIIRIWVEGEDTECVNETIGVNIERAKLSVRLRFCGADASGNYIETSGNP